MSLVNIRSASRSLRRGKGRSWDCSITYRGEIKGNNGCNRRGAMALSHGKLVLQSLYR